MASQSQSLLQVRDLNVSFQTYAGQVKAVRGVSFDVGVQETLAIVGESGCGKTVTSKAVMRLLDRSGGKIKVLWHSPSNAESPPVSCSRLWLF